MKKRKDAIKIVIVDDHPIVRQGIKKVIEKESDMIVCGEAGGTNEAISVIAREKPDIVVADISLYGGSSGLDLVRAIQARFSDVKSLVLSMHEESLYAERAIRAGARGYITKNEGPANIVYALRSVLKGDIYLSGAISTRLISKLFHGNQPKSQHSIIETLTNRELEIFQQIGNGFTTGEIARQLNLSPHTIEAHRKNIKDKLGLTSGSELNKQAIHWVLNSR
ncbi:MAG TPA: response regulator transcription factor [Spirochaetota bacterium]|nr:response regulator transcription factor [Spirochaetota bacterium]